MWKNFEVLPRPIFKKYCLIKRRKYDFYFNVSRTKIKGACIAQKESEVPF